MPGLLQTSRSCPFNPLCHQFPLMSSLLVHSFLIIQTVYFVRYLPLLLVSQIFPLNICFSSPSALFICPKNYTCPFLMVLSRDLLYPAISITSSFDFFSVHILIILLMYHISAASSLLSRSFFSVQQTHPCKRICRISEC